MYRVVRHFIESCNNVASSSVKALSAFSLNSAGKIILSVASFYSPAIKQGHKKAYKQTRQTIWTHLGRCKYLLKTY